VCGDLTYTTPRIPLCLLQQVLVSDATYSFGFEEPEKSSGLEWVLQPRWVPRDTSRTDAIGCLFELSGARGTRPLSADLKLPLTVPALIGRHALMLGFGGKDVRKTASCDEETGAIFELEWCERLLHVRHRRDESPQLLSCDRVIVEEFLGRDKQEYTWVFVHVNFEPDGAAVEAFAQHTKRPLETIERREEQCLLFFESSSDGTPIPSRDPLLHAVLPTGIKMPMACHMHAPWLLSVDRTDVQSPADNDWNGCILRQLPKLIFQLLRWLKVRSLECSGIGVDRFLRAGLRLLPVYESATRGTAAFVFMGKAVPVDTTPMRYEELTPTMGVTRAVDWRKAADAVRLPPELCELPLELLVAWAGGKFPIITPAMPHLVASSAMWQESAGIDELSTPDGLRRLNRYLRSKDTAWVERTAVHIIGSLALALRSSKLPLERDISKGGIKASSQTDSKGGLRLFFTVQGDMVLAGDEVRWPSSDLSTLPEAVQAELTSCSTSPMAHCVLFKIGQTESTKALPKQILLAAQQEVQRAQAEGETISIAEMVATYHHRLQNLLEVNPHQIECMRQLAKWAMDKRSTCVTHVLATLPSVSKAQPGATRVRVVVASATIIGEPYTNNELAHLLPSMARVSAEYVSKDGSVAVQSELRRWARFFSDCGVCVSPSVRPVVSPLSSSEVSLMPEKKAPKLRQNAKTVALPYGAGGLTHKRAVCVDAALTPAWTSALNSLSCPKAALFASLVASLDVDAAPDGSRAPDSLQATVDGRAVPVTETEIVHIDIVRSLPVHKRCFWLPPGQAGASFCNLRAARWVEQLREAKWLPGTDGLLHKPSQVSLASDAEQMFLHLKRVALPDSIRSALASSELAKLLAFGSAAPPSPLAMLEALCTASAGVDASSPIPGYSDDEVVSVWDRIASAVADARTGDALKARQLIGTHCIVPYAFTSRKSFGTQSRVPLSRCIVSSLQPPPTETAGLALQSLISCGWLVDLAQPNHPLSSHAKTLGAWLQLPSVCTEVAAQSFLHAVWKREPALLSIKQAFSLAMSTVLTARGAAHLRSDANLKLFVSAVGSLREGWVLLNGPASVRPMLADDKTKLALLRVAHNYQPIALLNHGHTHDAQPSALHRTLERLDAAVLSALQIPRLSSDSFKVEVTAVGTARVCASAKSRVQIVLDLLSIDPNRVTSVSKYSGLQKRLTVPPTSGTQPADAETVWAALNSTADLSIVGEGLDYFADLQEACLAMCPVSQPNSRALALLVHIEDGRNFEKFLLRSFADVAARHGIKLPVPTAIDVPRRPPPPPPPPPAVVGASEGGRDLNVPLERTLRGDPGTAGGDGGGKRSFQAAIESPLSRSDTQDAHRQAERDASSFFESLSCNGLQGSRSQEDLQAADEESDPMSKRALKRLRKEELENASAISAAPIIDGVGTPAARFPPWRIAPM
jgi:hypothetical protein